MRSFVLGALSLGWIMMAGVGCGGEPPGTPDPTARTERALSCSITATNCKGICVSEYGCCLKAGDDRAECIADRDACFADCARWNPEPTD